MALMPFLYRSLFRNLSILGCLLVFFPLSVATQAEGRFVSVIADLPLMPPLVEIPGSAVVFSKPEGRIVEISASGDVAKEAVLAYYGRALPQLGWHGGPGHRWVREGERLEIGFRRSAGKLMVQFLLAPADDRMKGQ
jgi:hypothetical protein